jgi:hypothetical protein
MPFGRDAAIAVPACGVAWMRFGDASPRRKNYGS